MNKPKVYFGSDHAGFDLKNQLLSYVQGDLGYEVEDCGAYECDPDDDYPEFIACAAKNVAADPAHAVAIILGGSGQGEAMIANRHKGVRAAVYYGGAHEMVALSREHNDANVLSLGARFLSLEEAKVAVKVWLSTPFSGDVRHVRRIRKIDTL